MANLHDKVTCPYCGAQLVLGDLPIVATKCNRGSASLFAGIDADVDAFSLSAPADGPALDEAPKPASGSRALRIVGGLWPVVREAPLAVRDGQPRFRRGRLLSASELPDVEDGTDPRDEAARVCTSCEWPLPLDVDDRRLVTIAIVGTKAASKSHFIAACFQAAVRGQALKGVGCTEFAFDEATAIRARKTYLVPMSSGRSLSETEPNRAEDERIQPLAVRATFGSGEPVTLLFHDIAGEVFQDRARRRHDAAFLRCADGIIFLVDPARYAPVTAHLLATHSVQPADVPIDQADLVNAVAEDLRRSHNLDALPVAVAVSKADLLGPTFGEDYGFDRDPPSERSAWFDDLWTTGREVHDVIATRLDAHDLLSAVSQFGNVTYHAVAAIGTQPDANGAIPAGLHPRRCLDPLVSILARVPGLLG